MWRGVGMRMEMVGVSSRTCKRSFSVCIPTEAVLSRRSHAWGGLALARCLSSFGSKEVTQSEAPRWLYRLFIYFYFSLLSQNTLQQQPNEERVSCGSQCRHGGRTTRQPVTSHPQSGSRERERRGGACSVHVLLVWG